VEMRERWTWRHAARRIAERVGNGGAATH